MYEQLMERALSLARHGEGYTSPNPMVGAVIVKDGAVVGEGYHHAVGRPHAEIEALRAAGDAAQGATMVVTLEPCNHHGRTPPCTQAIIEAGVAHVIYAAADPNPIASGGHQRLEAAGIRVTAGVQAAQAHHLNRFFFHHMMTKQPYVIAKFAMSLDGKIAAHTGHSKWITGEHARARGHRLRHAVDGILIGAGTALADNPRLTTRLPIDDPQHPLRIVLDSSGRVPLESHLFSPDLPGQTLVATTEAMPSAHTAALHNQGVDVLCLPAHAQGRVPLTPLLAELGARHIQSVLVEGGSGVLGSFLDAGLLDEVWAFVAPKLVGGQGAPSPVGGVGVAKVSDALHLKQPQVEMIDNDILIRGQRG